MIEEREVVSELPNLDSLSLVDQYGRIGPLSHLFEEYTLTVHELANHGQIKHPVLDMWFQVVNEWSHSDAGAGRSYLFTSADLGLLNETLLAIGSKDIAAAIVTKEQKPYITEASLGTQIVKRLEFFTKCASQLERAQRRKKPTTRPPSYVKADDVKNKCPWAAGHAGILTSDVAQTANAFLEAEGILRHLFQKTEAEVNLLCRTDFCERTPSVGITLMPAAAEGGKIGEAQRNIIGDAAAFMSRVARAPLPEKIHITWQLPVLTA